MNIFKKFLMNIKIKKKIEGENCGPYLYFKIGIKNILNNENIRQEYVRNSQKLIKNICQKEKKI